MDRERILEIALVAALLEVDLEAVTADAGVGAIVDRDGTPVGVDEVMSLEDAGFLTGNRGVNVRLSDGAELTLTVNAYRGPRD